MIFLGSTVLPECWLDFFHTFWKLFNIASAHSLPSFVHFSLSMPSPYHVHTLRSCPLSIFSILFSPWRWSSDLLPTSTVSDVLLDLPAVFLNSVHAFFSTRISTRFSPMDCTSLKFFMYQLLFEYINHHSFSASTC